MGFMIQTSLIAAREHVVRQVAEVSKQGSATACWIHEGLPTVEGKSLAVVKASIGRRAAGGQALRQPKSHRSIRVGGNVQPGDAARLLRTLPVRTVASCVSNILKKVYVHSWTDIAREAVRRVMAPR